MREEEKKRGEGRDAGFLGFLNVVLRCFARTRRVHGRSLAL